ncbi:MAG: methionine--tRNA ligase [Elusimicrobia bacterium]|nr:methionine--tRNA ligase [Elusimicrobiota bacterium]
MRTILIGVAWPYANSALHLGHVAGTWLPADIFGRYHRLRGHRVLMVSGSDEHGTPITVTADKEKKTPQEIVNRFHAENHNALKRLGVDIECYFRTTDTFHKQVAQRIFLTLLEKGLIVERASQALFCVACNRFLPDRYVEGVCPHCQAPDARGDQCDRCGKTLDPADLKSPRCRLCGNRPEFRETRLHYLRLPALSAKLEDYLKSRKGWRSNVLRFTQNWIKEGLNDRPITRDLHWGVPVPLPGHDGKCLYVWFEAVIGYLSAAQFWAKDSGSPEAWEEFWTNPQAESYYFIGKDNIPFHTIIWPAILLGLGGLNLPTNVPANEYLLLSGEKFSKSRGIGASLTECLEAFDPDQIRYHLASIMPEASDANFSWDDFIQKNNDELLSTVGNLINRVLLFAQKTFGKIPQPSAIPGPDEAMLEAAAKRHLEAAGQAIEACEFKKGLREILAMAQAGNQYVNGQAPWKLAKQDPARCQSVTYAALDLCRCLTVAIHPYLPFSATRAWSMLGFDKPLGPGDWGERAPKLEPGRLFGEIGPLFRKIEREPVAP